MLQEHGEARCWKRLSRFLAHYPDWPVLHYGETESLALRKMAQRQGVSEADQQALRHRLVDVHARLRLHWRMPLNSYGLKTVADWLGSPLEPGRGGWRSGSALVEAVAQGPVVAIVDRFKPCAGSSPTTGMTAWPPGPWPPGRWLKIALFSPPSVDHRTSGPLKRDRDRLGAGFQPLGIKGLASHQG